MTVKKGTKYRIASHDRVVCLSSSYDMSQADKKDRVHRQSYMSRVNYRLSVYVWRPKALYRHSSPFLILFISSKFRSRYQGKCHYQICRAFVVAKLMLNGVRGAGIRYGQVGSLFSPRPWPIRCPQGKRCGHKPCGCPDIDVSARVYNQRAILSPCLVG